RMVSLAALVLAPMLLLAALQAAVTGSGALLWRAVLNLPVATLGTTAAITVTQLLLGVTDWASAELAATIPGDTRSAFDHISHAPPPRRRPAHPAALQQPRGRGRHAPPPRLRSLRPLHARPHRLDGQHRVARGPRTPGAPGRHPSPVDRLAGPPPRRRGRAPR